MKHWIGALGACGLAAAVLAAPTASNAAVRIYSGYDTSATGPGDKPNSDAARAAFAAEIAGLMSLVNSFESGPTGVVGTYDVGGGATLTSNNPVARPLTIKTSPYCGFYAECGGNTTTGGRNFVFISSVPVTFTFAHPIVAFGAYFSGGEVEGLKLTFDDGTERTAPVPALKGASFVGFTDFGRQITSVTFNPGRDIMALDDVVFAFAPTGVPEPSAWALMIAGFGLTGASLRTRRRLRLS
ncbi:PEPxxWA-CTERM sorting domain-containing protein [Phenylobacterium sp.]|uniref:PEPxxWA-CTERM sorting domain-containing protein n=1 Tax=Phenylobacterium sp. TaxID=1871053 RepID=UPI0025D0893A|nr:PEPxxWA-CTERM sorting domain-containing protein [Phenylobacterium sp.]MBX3484691.1 PEPxxWA-CTERM sorting domain-containing protein [Phenylobacterium sp.]MCW5759565.1 PEPxxWA-CTERM sorting domain-containing protein [Phenylobacterium sp.]